MRAPNLFVLVLAVALAGCGEDDISNMPGLIGVCESVGLCDVAPPLPEEVIVILDGTPGSTANLASIEPLLAAILDRLADRPGSTIRVYTVGTGANDSHEIASVVVPEPPRRMRNPRAHRSQTISELRDELVPPIAQALEGAARQRRSAIAETITLAGRSSPRSARRWLIVVSDLREMMRPSGLDLECPRELPTLQRFRRSLEQRGLLREGTLEGFDVLLVDHGLPPFPDRRRCDLTIRRADELRELWRQVLLAAGARSVVVVRGTPTFDDVRREAAPRDQEGEAP